ncbi:MAG: hypothetical protein WBV39_12310, partial [Rudaea sp.]
NGEGGAGVGGPGGFAGGGGAGGLSESGPAEYGSGGQFGGGGFSGAGGGGGGLGGAVFVRAGTVTIINSTFSGNAASGGTGGSGASVGQGKGGAVFAIDSTTNTNGNQDGMPAVLPIVAGCSNTFSGSSATDALATDTDNASTYGVSLAQLTTLCDEIFTDGFE